MGGAPLMILLAEDDMGHAMLIQRNLRRAGVRNEIVHVTDGQEALDYVRAEGAYVGRPAPEALVILLDINMPRVDGIEALRQLKADEETRKIPAIMLTTTDDPREIDRCYEYGCSVYITKPVEYEKFSDAIRQFGLFLQVVKLPVQDT